MVKVNQNRVINYIYLFPVLNTIYTKTGEHFVQAASKAKLEMAIHTGSFFVCLLSFVLLASSGTNEAAVTPSHSSRPFNRTIFPPDFIFGAGSSAYQVRM